MNPVWAQHITGAVANVARIGTRRGKSFMHPRERAGQSRKGGAGGRRFKEGGR